MPDPRDSSGLSRESIAPGFDVFVIDHVSLGLNVTLGHSSGTSFDANGVKSQSSGTSYGIGPRVGFDIPVSGALSLWPQVELVFGGGTSELTSSAGSNDHTNKVVWVQASIPLLVHPAAHFFLGAGPYVFHHLSSVDQNNVENDGTSVGASFLLGGWL